MKTRRLMHKGKVILPMMAELTGIFEIAQGLMFSGKAKCERGVLMKMPSAKDVQFGASVTMFFTFHELDVLFINMKMKVVDKATLKPWRPNYTPKAPAKYIVESYKGMFKNIKVGDEVEFR